MVQPLHRPLDQTLAHAEETARAMRRAYDALLNRPAAERQQSDWALKMWEADDRRIACDQIVAQLKSLQRQQ